MITEDLYQILEVDENATAQEIRRAYYRLAKFYHPDLHATDGEDTTEKFLAIQSAYEVLGSSDSRAQYDEERTASTKGGSDATTPAAEAEKPRAATPAAPAVAEPSLSETRDARAGYMKAEMLIERGDVEKAAHVMSAVVRTVPDEPEYLSLYGYSLALTGDKLHKARDMCRRSLEAEPYNVEFRARLGYVYMRAGLQKTAEEYFEAVLKTIPDHPIASVYSAAGAKKSGGLLGGLKNLFQRS